MDAWTNCRVEYHYVNQEYKNENMIRNIRIKLCKKKFIKKKLYGILLKNNEIGYGNILVMLCKAKGHVP